MEIATKCALESEGGTSCTPQLTTLPDWAARSTGHSVMMPPTMRATILEFMKDHGTLTFSGRVAQLTTSRIGQAPQTVGRTSARLD